MVDLAGRGRHGASGCKGCPEDDGRRELAGSAGAEKAEAAKTLRYSAGTPIRGRNSGISSAMARKLKTYTTSAGFFDLAVAAPSMKAALLGAPSTIGLRARHGQQGRD